MPIETRYTEITINFVWIVNNKRSVVQEMSKTSYYVQEKVESIFKPLSNENNQFSLAIQIESNFKRQLPNCT